MPTPGSSGRGKASVGIHDLIAAREDVDGGPAPA